MVHDTNAITAFDYILPLMVRLSIYSFLLNTDIRDIDYFTA